MANGTITVNASGGVFYDQGGSATSYANNLNLTETFCSGVAGKCVSFTFQTFNAEATNDVLTVYDG